MTGDTINHTVYRKRDAKTDKLRNDILSFLNTINNPISTQEIAESVKKPWHSVQTRCLKLQLDNKINGFRVGRINLWQIK